MKDILVISLILFQQVSLIFSQTDTTFIALRGFEDSTGNTHLYYKTKYSTYDFDDVSDNLYVDSTIFIHSILNTQTNVSRFLQKGHSNIYYPENHLQYVHIDDIEFFDNDPEKYIYITNTLGIDPDGKVSRYDQNYVLGILGHFNDLYLLPNNSNHVYAVAYNWLFKSYDGGFTWEQSYKYNENRQYVKHITFSPFDQSIIYGVSEKQLVKSLDTGKTFTQVTSIPDWDGDIKLFFDKDQKHIYAAINRYEFNNYYSDILGLLYVSNNNGDTNSWALLRTEYNKISLCNDDSISGNIFLSVNNEIYESTDYGNSFTNFAELAHHANGLYKKPKGELYATISNKLIKISRDSTITILTKSIEKSLNFYPLAVGNKWFYNHSGVSYDTKPNPFNYNYTEEITKDTIDQNGIRYFYLSIDSLSKKYWIRIDSLTGKVYKRYSFQVEENLQFDLTVNSGDKFLTSEGIVYNTEKSDTILWEDKRYTKIYQLDSFGSYQIIFVENIGIVKRLNEFDFGNSITSLKGCIIDGIVYGDTTVVGVEQNLILITQFSLSQNYPNPFNPTTTIKYSIPSAIKLPPLAKGRAGVGSFVTLKVYDILGREVITLVNKQQKPGNYQVTFDANNLSCGVFLYRLKVGNYVKTKKMILLQ